MNTYVVLIQHDGGGQTALLCEGYPDFWAAAKDAMSFAHGKGWKPLPSGGHEIRPEDRITPSKPVEAAA